MSYLGTKPANSPLTSELIPNSIITDPKIAAMAATKLTGQVPDANAPVGSVIQVVSSSNPNSGHIVTTSTSYVSSGISVTITPQKAGNIIKVDFAVSMSFKDASGQMAAAIYRNGSIYGGNFAMGYTFTSEYGPNIGTVYYTTTDTSSQTFTVFFLATASASYLVHDNGSYALTATEIAV